MDLPKLVNQSTNLMFNYPKRTAEQLVKDTIKRLIGRKVYVPNCIGWPNGLCALGLLEQIKHNDNIALKKRDAKNLMSYFDKWIRKGMTVSRVEDFISGYVLLELMDIMDSLDMPYSDDYHKAVIVMYDYLLNARKDAQGTFVYNPNQKEDDIFADMIGMVCPFLVKYGVRYDKPEAVKLGLNQLKLFLSNAIDYNTKLPYHAYEYHNDNIDKLGLLAWGRAVGWVMMGASGMRLSLKHAKAEYFEEMEYLTDLLIEFGEIIKNYQLENGMFGWHIIDLDGPADSSATAMILYSLCDVRDDARVKSMFDQAYSGLMKCVTADGDVIQGQAECLGIGLHPMKFGSYPWTVGPTLALISTLG